MGERAPVAWRRGASWLASIEVRASLRRLAGLLPRPALRLAGPRLSALLRFAATGLLVSALTAAALAGFAALSRAATSPAQVEAPEGRQPFPAGAEPGGVAAELRSRDRLIRRAGLRLHYRASEGALAILRAPAEGEVNR